MANSHLTVAALTKDFTDRLEAMSAAVLKTGNAFVALGEAAQLVAQPLGSLLPAMLSPGETVLGHQPSAAIAPPLQSRYVRAMVLSGDVPAGRPGRTEP